MGTQNTGAARDFARYATHARLSDEDREFARSVAAEKGVVMVDYLVEPVVPKPIYKQKSRVNPSNVTMGVVMHAGCRAKPYQARFGRKHLGYYATIKEAAVAHDKESWKVRRSLNRLNYPENVREYELFRREVEK